MPGNYLERLRIAIDIENQTQEDQINPTISVGLNNELETHSCVDKKFGTYLFDCTVFTAGIQTVNLHINELASDSWRIGKLYIRDLRMKTEKSSPFVYAYRPCRLPPTPGASFMPHRAP